MIRPLILACATLAMAAPALAQNVDQDVKCLLASNVFAKTEKDAGRRQIAAASALYYYGKVDGRVAPAALKDKMLAQAKTFTATNLGGIMTSCAQQLQARQKALQAIGQQVAAAAPPAPAGPKK